MIKVAINGLGRIGRTTLRQMLKDKAFSIVAVNDLSPLSVSAHLLKYDSVYGVNSVSVEVKNEKLYLNKKQVHYLQEKQIENINWKKLGVDLVIDCTGIYSSFDKAQQHIKSGAKKVDFILPNQR
jgi:glyceraldehyde 3-phosphate dehydrogenase